VQSNATPPTHRRILNFRVLTCILHVRISPKIQAATDDVPSCTGSDYTGLPRHRIKTATSFSISNAQNKGPYSAQVLWLRGSDGPLALTGVSGEIRGGTRVRSKAPVKAGTG